MNVYPTEKEEAAMRDVAKHPYSSLQDRADRLGDISRAGVQHLLVRCRGKGFAKTVDKKWSLTIRGRAWIRPTMPTREAR